MGVRYRSLSRARASRLSVDSVPSLVQYSDPFVGCIGHCCSVRYNQQTLVHRQHPLFYCRLIDYIHWRAEKGDQSKDEQPPKGRCPKPRSLEGASDFVLTLRVTPLYPMGATVSLSSYLKTLPNALETGFQDRIFRNLLKSWFDPTIGKDATAPRFTDVSAVVGSMPTTSVTFALLKKQFIYLYIATPSLVHGMEVCGTKFPQFHLNQTVSSFSFALEVIYR